MLEILAPAGSRENLICAVNAGADAVYLGLKNFSARMNSENFNDDDLKFSISYAKVFDVKVYITVNTLIKDKELPYFFDAIKFAMSCGADAFIIQDIFLGKILKHKFPEIVLHLSTQAGTCNVYGARLAKRFGFSRVILARETKLKDIGLIAKEIETEAFIQGALCSSFSGHCYFSSFVGGCSGNRGMCKQPCRKLYKYSNQGKLNYALSLADLSVQDSILVLKDLGVSSFKIEGRMRSLEYVYYSTKFYKQMINGVFDQNLFDQMQIAFNRGDYTKGLASYQDANFISNKIQSNKGLFIGKIKKLVKDCIYLDDDYEICASDGLKIIRNGYEVGSAIVSTDKCIRFHGNVKIGDDVHLTKTNFNINLNRKKEIFVKVYAKVGEKLKIYNNDFSVESQNILECAKNCATTKDDIIKCINKTDIYPFNPIIEIDTDDKCFIVKSMLNNLRSEFYNKLFYINNLNICENTDKYNINYNLQSNNNHTVISNVIENYDNISNFVYHPLDYNNIEISKLNNLKCKKWLYIPPFMDNEDLQIVNKVISNFDGIYGESYWTLEFALENNVKLYCGNGFNVFNKVDLFELISLGVNYIAASKELSYKEILQIDENLQVLTYGTLELMDFIYCPFGKDCKNCKYENNVYLNDEFNHKFRVLRYKTHECRFKIFNCYDIVLDRFNNQIIDLRTIDPLIHKKYIDCDCISDRKDLSKEYTFGNYLKGLVDYDK